MKIVSVLLFLAVVISSWPASALNAGCAPDDYHCQIVAPPGTKPDRVDHDRPTFTVIAIVTDIVRCGNGLCLTISHGGYSPIYPSVVLEPTRSPTSGPNGVRATTDVKVQQDVSRAGICAGIDEQLRRSYATANWNVAIVVPGLCGQDLPTD